MFAPLSAYVNDSSFLTTLETMLSGSQQLRRDLQIALSSIPAHPYEKLKNNLLGSDFVPLTIDELSSDKDFCPTTCLNNICDISIKLNTNVMSHFYTVTSGNLSAMDCNAFIELSTTTNGEEFVVNSKRSSGYLSMLETIKHIPITLLEKDPHSVAKKLISHYINVMS